MKKRIVVIFIHDCMHCIYLQHASSGQMHAKNIILQTKSCSEKSGFIALRKQMFHIILSISFETKGFVKKRLQSKWVGTT